MKKLFALITALLLLASLLVGCSPAEELYTPGGSETETGKAVVNIGGIIGPTGIGMANLIAVDGEGTTANDYRFAFSSVPQDIAAKLTQGAVDIAALPTNLAVSLYNKTSGGVKILAVNTLGVLHILENGNSVKSIADLKGKTIYSTGEGANPEYILKYVLEKNGLTPGEDVTVKFIAENDALSAQMASGDIKLALVPEPQVSVITTKNPAVRAAINMNDAWEAVADEGSKLMMGCVAVRAEFLKNNKAAVDAFLTEYATSITAATADVQKTANLCKTYGILPNAAIAAKAIPNCALTCVKGAEMKAQIQGYYNVLFTANPKSIGGKLPADDFYYVG